VNEKIFLVSLPAYDPISNKKGSKLIERLIEYSKVVLKMTTKKYGGAIK
jgi:hypothetical protein